MSRVIGYAPVFGPGCFSLSGLVVAGRGRGLLFPSVSRFRMVRLWLVALAAVVGRGISSVLFAVFGSAFAIKQRPPLASEDHHSCYYRCPNKHQRDPDPLLPVQVRPQSQHIG